MRWKDKILTMNLNDFDGRMIESVDYEIICSNGITKPDPTSANHQYQVEKIRI